MNYLIIIEYNGTNYNGWQSQKCNKAGNAPSAGRTVENEIIKAIKIVTRIDVQLLVSGRTDAGVHALNQIANFKLPFYYDLNRFKITLNGILPPDISIKDVEIVHDSFHATYDAVSKIYLYKINVGIRSPLMSNMSWFVKEDLNAGLIEESAGIFTGRHNFFNFAKKDKDKSYKNYYRTIAGIKICGKNYGFDIYIEGEGFLRHMVRRMIGSIILCGAGKINTACIRNMLKEENFSCGAPCAPPCGLFLYSVRYEHKIYC
jgi:tRNA pseudouridine38-40 synthase